MRLKILSRVALVGVLVGSVVLLSHLQAAQAASLTLSNVNVDTGVAATVTVQAGQLIDDGGVGDCDFSLGGLTVAAGSFNCLSFSLSSYSGFGAGVTPKALLEIGYQSTAQVDTTKGFTTPGYSSSLCSGTGCQEDGFGKFLTEANDGPNFALTTVNLALTAFTDFGGNNANNTNHMFAVHVTFYTPAGSTGGCSLWVSDGPYSGTLPPAPGACTDGGTTEEAPEPSLALLLGSGLALVVGSLGGSRLKVA